MKEMFTHKVVNPIDQSVWESEIVGNVWNDNVPTITTFFTSSSQPFTIDGSYQYDVYSKPLSVKTWDGAMIQIQKNITDS